MWWVCHQSMWTIVVKSRSANPIAIVSFPTLGCPFRCRRWHLSCARDTLHCAISTTAQSGRNPDPGFYLRTDFSVPAAVISFPNSWIFRICSKCIESRRRMPRLSVVFDFDILRASGNPTERGKNRISNQSKLGDLMSDGESIWDMAFVQFLWNRFGAAANVKSKSFTDTSIGWGRHRFCITVYISVCACGQFCDTIHGSVSMAQSTHK